MCLGWVLFSKTATANEEEKRDDWFSLEFYHTDTREGDLFVPLPVLKLETLKPQRQTTLIR